MTATLATSTVACPDCETGRCLCLSGCDACAGTGECPTCCGSQIVGSSATPDSAKSQRCAVCKRGPNDFSLPDPYAGLNTVAERIEYSRNRHYRANRPICGGCGRIFQSVRVAGAILAEQAGQLLLPTGRRPEVRNRARKREDCAGCGRRERVPSQRDSLAGLTPEECTERLNAVAPPLRAQNAYRCAVCGRAFRLPLRRWARKAFEAGALLFFDPSERYPIPRSVTEGDVTFIVD